MTNKTNAAIEEAADIHLAGYDHKCAYARHQGFMAGMQEVVEHPERYGLQKKITPTTNTLPGCDFEDFHSKYSDADE